MRPTGIFLNERFFVEYSLLQLFGIVGLTLPFFLWIYFVGMLILGSLLLLDRRTVLNSFREERLIAAKNMMLFENKEIFIEIIPGPGVIFQKEVQIDLPPLNYLEKGSDKTVLRLTKRADGRYSFSGKIKVKAIKLGREELRSVYVFCKSKAGLWTKISIQEMSPSSVQINPRVKKLSKEEFTEIARKNQLYIGQRLKMRGQAADQYYTTRKFQYPDSLRYIDQKRTAKFGDVMTKTFEELRNHHLIIGLDMGRTMAGDIAGSRKQDFYISAALEMAKHGIENRDTVDFFAFSQKIHMSISRARTLDPFRLLVEKARVLEPRLEESNYSLIPKMISNLTGQRSIVVLLTDLSRPSVQESLISALIPICQKHLVVAVGLIDNDFSLDTQIMRFSKSKVDDEDVSSMLYNYWLEERLKLFQKRLVQVGGASLNLSEENWMSVIERLYSGLRQSLFA